VPDLLASYFTIAGDHPPSRATGVSPHPLRARIEAAARAGYTGIGLYASDLAAALDSHGWAGIRALLAGNGIRHVEVECLRDWFADGAARAASDTERRFLLEAAGELGAFQLKAGGGLPGRWTARDMTEPFGVLCDDAARVGARVSLEMVPFSTVRDLPTALAIVEGAGRRNGGLMLDFWHLDRAGVTPAQIAALPPERLFGVELCDAPRHVEGTMLEDTWKRRRFCGDGEVDIAGYLAAIEALGFSGPFGCEVISDAVRAMPLEDAAHRSHDTAAAMFRVTA
jgi:sugar phosphate isomerase/epimerase